LITLHASKLIKPGRLDCSNSQWRANASKCTWFCFCIWSFSHW